MARISLKTSIVDRVSLKTSTGPCLLKFPAVYSASFRGSFDKGSNNRCRMSVVCRMSIIRRHHIHYCQHCPPPHFYSDEAEEDDMKEVHIDDNDGDNYCHQK